MCIEYKSKSNFYRLPLKEKLAKSAKKSFHLFLYGTHHLGINLLPLFKSLFTIYDSIFFLFFIFVLFLQFF